MTRKQALYKVLEDTTDEEIRNKLNEILGAMPFNKWDEQTIFDTIDQFIIDNKRIPTVTDFKKKGLPPHPVVKLRFGINLKDFLEKHYPSNRLCSSKIYSDRTREDWKNYFIEEYHKNKPKAAVEYNNTRSSGSPTWVTISRMFDIFKWLEWLTFCGIVPYRNKREHPRGTALTNNIRVTSSIIATTTDNRHLHIQRDGDKITATNEILNNDKRK